MRGCGKESEQQRGLSAGRHPRDRDAAASNGLDVLLTTSPRKALSTRHLLSTAKTQGE